MDEPDAVGYVVLASVDCGDCERFSGDVEGSDCGLGKIGCESDCDGTGARADVGDLQRLVCRQ